MLGDDALAVLKDIKRWLRLYDDKTNRLDVARLLAEANLVKGDLLEILAGWPDDSTESSFRSKVSLLCGTVPAVSWGMSHLLMYLLSGSSDPVDLAY